VVARSKTAVLRLVKPDPESAPSPVRPPPRSAPSLDDTELLRAVADGDPYAASALYARTRPTIDRTIVRLLGSNDADHDDLVQLSMIELVGSLRSFRGECSLDTWTSRITAHAVYKQIRSRRSIGRMLGVVSELDVGHGQDLEGEAVMRDALARIQCHLDAIDHVKAWTLILHDVCGYDLREIAAITDASIAAAQSRLIRGRAELHARIERDPSLADALENGERR
jgi:RNA polymerase sigma-70 factor, ECF subfamily